VSNDNVLIAANSYAGKSYCLTQWCDAAAATLAAYREEYPHAKTDVLIVDNTRGSDGYAELCAEQGVRVIKITPKMTFENTMHLGWQIIHQEAIIEDYDYIFSLEADNIVPAHTLPAIMRVMRDGGFHIVTHTYPFHLLDYHLKGRNRTTNPRRFYYNELGICLMTRQVLSYGLADYSRYDNFTNALFHSVSRYALGWASSTALIAPEDNLHIDGYEQEYTQFWARPGNDGRWNPYENMDDALDSIYGKHLPECIREDYEKHGIGIAMAMEPGTYEAKAEGTVIHGGNGNGKVKQGAGRARKRGTRPKVEAVGKKV